MRLLSPKLYKGLKKSHKQTSFALEKLKMDTNNNFNLLRVAFAVGILDESIFDRIRAPDKVKNHAQNPMISYPKTHILEHDFQLYPALESVKIEISNFGIVF